MSLATWKKESYPTPASKCAEKDALHHVLRKYLGTRKAVLKRHRVVAINSTLTDGVYQFHFNEKTCALCKFYRVRHCRSACPLVTHAGLVCGRAGSVYNHWVRTGDPEPMIRALRRAVKKQERKGA